MHATHLSTGAHLDMNDSAIVLLAMAIDNWHGNMQLT